MNYEQTLVYILAVALAVLLGLAIALAVYLLKLVRSLQSIAAKVEHASDNVAAFSAAVRKTAGPAGVIGVLRVITKEIMNHKNKEKSDE